MMLSSRSEPGGYADGAGAGGQKNRFLNAKSRTGRQNATRPVFVRVAGHEIGIVAYLVAHRVIQLHRFFDIAGRSFNRFIGEVAHDFHVEIQITRGPEIQRARFRVAFRGMFHAPPAPIFNQRSET
jgi:hypothetical protein